MDIDSRCSYYSDRVSAWKEVCIVDKGARAVRNAGALFLPKEHDEEESSYKNRLARAVFTNYYRKTIDTVVGIIFNKPIQLSGDNNKMMSEHWDDLDLSGTVGDILVAKLFREALNKGESWVLLDMPKPPKNLSRKDLGRFRPYWMVIEPEKVIDFQYAPVDGVDTLVYLKIKDVVKRRTRSYVEKDVARYRVYRLVRNVVKWEVHEEDPLSRSRETLKKSGEMSIGMIPAVRLKLEDHPPFDDLLEHNKLHYRVSSDKHYNLHLSSIPLLTVLGFDTGVDENGKRKDPKISIGVNRAFVSTNVNAKLAWVTCPTDAVEISNAVEEKLEEKMAKLGLEVLKTKQEVTATQRMLDGDEESTKIQYYIRNLTDTAEQALVIHAKMAGFNQSGSIEINDDFMSAIMGAEDIASLLKLKDSGVISRDTTRKSVAHNSKLLPKDFDLEAEEEKIQKEQASYPSLSDFQE